jgi:acyl-CoA synthetase (AMP-forming)/AMP-acid ligase II
MVIGDIPVSNARLFPYRLALVDGQTGERTTWGEANLRINRLANGLLQLGITKGDRVALLSENSLACAEFYFATAKIGVIGCPLNYRLKDTQIGAVLRKARPKVSFVQPKYQGLFASAIRDFDGNNRVIDLPGVTRGPTAYQALLDESSIDEPTIQVEENDILMITYSSGTTGLPKGVISTHRNRIAYCLESCLFADRYSWKDVVLNSAPFCAGVTGSAVLAAAAFAGAATVMHVLKGNTWAEVVESERVTALITTTARMVPVWEFLAKEGKQFDLSSLQRVTTGGQPHSEADIRKIIEFCGVDTSAKMYGLSEASCTGTRLLASDVTAGLRPEATEKEKRRLESVGKPLLSMRIKVVDVEGQEVPPGQVGEVLLAGDAVSPGYWEDPEQTARQFRNGWLHTRDMGALDEDGYLYLKGRKDYMVRTGGLLVSPREVEAVLKLHPSVADAAVLGVPDERWGEAVKAVVCLRKEDRVVEEDLKAHCRQHLAGYQVPKHFVFVEDLPRDEAGRVRVKDLKDRYSNIEPERNRGQLGE